jgi:hypothetical protein
MKEIVDERDDLLKANQILQALIGNRDKEVDRLRKESRTHLMLADQRQAKYCDALQEITRLRNALAPFAKYEMVMVGMSDTVSRRDYADCGWIAAFDGPNQPAFRHFKEAREALAISQAHHHADRESTVSEPHRESSDVFQKTSD